MCERSSAAISHVGKRTLLERNEAMGVEVSLSGSIRLMFLTYEELSEALTATMTADRECNRVGEG